MSWRRSGVLFSFFSVSSWTTASEPLFYKWNVPEQNSIKWLPQLENWELLQRLKHQGSESFSPTLREFQIREWVCQLRETEKDFKGFLCMWTQAWGNKHTQRDPPTADAIFHVLLWTIPSSQEGEGKERCETRCWRHARNPSPLRILPIPRTKVCPA